MTALSGSVRWQTRDRQISIEAGIKAAKPSAKASDLFQVMSELMSANGGDVGSVGRLGHGLGLQLTEWPSLTPNDMTVLEAGMVITIEPGMSYGNGKIMLHEENIVIGESKARLLSHRAPAQIPVI